jgi:hypothetical protein
MRVFNSKKGYFFIIDALIAMTVLSVGLFILMSSYSATPPATQLAITSADVLEYLTQTSMREFVDPLGIVDKRELLDRGSLSNSIAEQAIEYLNLSQTTTAENLIVEAVDQVLPIQYNIRIIIGDYTIFERGIERPEDAELLIPARGYVVTVFNQSRVIGPYPIEVDIWQ